MLKSDKVRAKGKPGKRPSLRDGMKKRFLRGLKSGKKMRGGRAEKISNGE